MAGEAGLELRRAEEGGATPLSALEFFCGIGGFAAAAVGTNLRIVAALDQSPAALQVYRLNFPEHDTRQVDLEKVTAAELARYGARLWWLSPPCQPYSVRGHGHDLDDPRARSLARILEVFPDIAVDRMPSCIALENVAGFARSRARQWLVKLLDERGYQIRERHLCPTALGVPSRRPRYYLLASRHGFARCCPLPTHPRPLHTFLDPLDDESGVAELLVDPAVVARFGEGFRVLEPRDPTAYTTCFTAGYGKSLMHAGSYLHCRCGIRRFSPGEIACLLGFSGEFRFPDAMPLRKRWQLLGNSVSVVVVRELLRELGVAQRQ
jgi:site-specific DNA-cytosine methylase